MIVSWKWLKRYLSLDDLSDKQVAEKLSLSGLNHESTSPLAGDWAIDLEVTSNRPDCLAHIGVAREISALFDRPMTIPAPSVRETGPAVSSLVSVDIHCPEQCPRYTARLIRGVKVGATPAWMQELLANASGDPSEFRSINNIADITNFVMKECGQPLHAFDFDQLQGQKIIVRLAEDGEVLEAIDHRTYALGAGMCVIADELRPVALAGIMGGASTEISERTTNVLIESASFEPGVIRQTSRKLKLASDSSYRFERTIDPEAADWASRRCCELILEYCGGELCEGVVDVGLRPTAPRPVVFRLGQIARVLGIEVDSSTVERILRALGNAVESSDSSGEVSGDRSVLRITPPSWRRDLTREADLIEEVARMVGYDQIPEDHKVSMAVSSPPPIDTAAQRIRQTLTAAGFSEALSPSLVPQVLSDLYSPWTESPALTTLQPMLGVLDTKFWSTAGPVDGARRSLIPSLLELRRLNEFRHNLPVELFEIAKIYLPQDGFPREPLMIGLCSGRDLLAVKSYLEALVAAVCHKPLLEVEVMKDPFFAPGRALLFKVQGEVFGCLGQVADRISKQLKLAPGAVVGEFFLDSLLPHQELVPQSRRQSAYPAIERDLNLVMSSAIKWADLERCVRQSAGQWLESVKYRETYVNEGKDGPMTKRILFTLTLRSLDETLTGKQADETIERVLLACDQQLAARLLMN